MELSISTPEKLIFKGEAESINIPTQSGMITVLPKHTALLSAVSFGRIKIITQNQEKYFPCEGGVLEVSEGRAVILLRTLRG
ncbi:MAG: F0F1 ATP synthase subunit epsilon [Candidatus Paceibacterota bacterium]|jgi:F-type H+-transporting ATPase subunit epsilon